MSARRFASLAALLVLLALVNAAIVAGGHALAATVVPGWKKGPLIDPAAPYSPENAIPLAAVVTCVVVDVYVLGLAAWRSRFRARWWVPFGALALGIGIAEAGMRVHLATHQITYFRPHPTLHWQVRPNLRDFENVSGGGLISTNADGMRNVTEPRDKPAGAYRVLVLGDSSNFGHGVGPDEVWSSQLAAILNEAAPDRKWEVLNGACPGWTTFQAIEFLREIGFGYHPDLVIAGFNNDPGPEYFGDSARVMSGPVRALNGVLFRMESYLVTRELVLATARRFVPAPEVPYTAREAGASPTYGKLQEDEQTGLVPRVPLDEFVGNLRTLNAETKAHDAGFVWINMPINRAEPDLVDRYVNPEYRTAAAEVAKEEGYPLVDVDARWLRTREAEVHIVGHVFHPSPSGHRRMAEQIGQELSEEGVLPGAPRITIGGPPAAATEATLRFGISTFTPVHAHVAAVLAAHPELAEKHGLTVEVHDYLSGKGQGDDVASGALDAFFTCEVPAVQMVGSRVDVRIVASPGSLGEVMVIGRAGESRTLEDLRGKKVGLAAGSTTDMDWQRWGAGLGATVVPLATDALVGALDAGEVDAVVAWDPWATQMVLDGKGRRVVLERRTFRSDLAVSVAWSTYEPGRARRLVALVADALTLAAADRPRWDAEVARVSGWPVAVVRAVADKNALLGGDGDPAMPLTVADEETLGRALAFTRMRGLALGTLLDSGLLDGRLTAPRYSPTASFNNGKPPPTFGPPGQGGPPPGQGPPGRGGPPPGQGPPGQGPPGQVHGMSNGRPVANP